MKRLNYLVDRILKEAYSPISGVFVLYQPLRKLNKLLKVSFMKEAFEELRQFVQGPIKEHRETFQANMQFTHFNSGKKSKNKLIQEDNLRDFTDAYLKEMNERASSDDKVYLYSSQQH